MIFLIEYDRGSAKLYRCESFPDDASEIADRERLRLEIELLAAGVVREVVLLVADSESHLHASHRRYFEKLEALSSRVGRLDE